jgi:hypothetical protein
MSRKSIDLSTLPVPDKKRRRASWFAPVQRFWVRNPAGGCVRWLQVDRYDDAGNCRDFMLRLAPNDPRPRGIELCRKGHWSEDQRAFHCANLARYTIGVWTETVYAEPAPVLLLTETAVSREEAA